MRKDDFKKPRTDEGLADLAQRAEQDHEVQMARADLYKLAKYSIKLHDMLKAVSEEEGLMGWQAAKITKASDYISSVYHNLDYKMKFGEEQEEEEVVEGKDKKKKKKNESLESRLESRLAEKAKKPEGISESVKNFTSAGIPREYAEAFMKKYAVKQEAPIKEIDGVPKTSDIDEGSFIINVLPNGDVRGLGKTEVGFKEYRYSLLHMIDGQIERPDRTANYNQAKQGMSKKGKFYTLHQSYWGLYRGRKPDETRTSQDQMVSGENIYGYMDKMFMTKMKPLLTQMSKDIWNKSEELDDKRPSIYSDSDLERAMKYRGYIKDFIEQGFTRKSMEDMLTMVNAYSPYSRKTYEQTEEALKKALAEVPAFRAKWAKQILSAARNYHKQVNNMYYKSTMDALKGEPT